MVRDGEMERDGEMVPSKYETVQASSFTKQLFCNMSKSELVPARFCRKSAKNLTGSLTGSNWFNFGHFLS